MNIVVRDDGYVIYRNGDIVSPKGRRLKSHVSSHGYVKVCINKRGRFLHRLLAEAFIPNPKGKATVNHKDGDKTNNAIDNLEWATHKENSRHAQITGLCVDTPSGHRHGQSRLSPEALADIRSRNLSGVSAGWMRELARQYGVSTRTVYNAAKGKTYARA
jgi:hypothetical protein